VPIANDIDLYASATQHLVTAAGIVVAGAWVLYTFWGQHVIQRANLDLALAETNVKKLDQDAFQQPILSISITVAPATETGDVVAVSAAFGNDGKLALKFQDSSLILRQVYDAAGSAVPRKTVFKVPATTLDESGRPVALPPRILRAGQKRNVVFLTQKLNNGAYFMQISATYWGMDILDGEFMESGGDGIRAVEQACLVIPFSPRLKAP
jgi:hypothetical protein